MKKRIKIFTEDGTDAADMVEEKINKWLAGMEESQFGVDFFLSTQGARVTVMATYRDETA